MLGVTRILPAGYFIAEAAFTLIVITYIIYKNDETSAKVFLFGTFAIGFVEALAVILGTRIFIPFHWAFYTVIAMTEGGSAFAIVWILANKFVEFKKKIKRKQKRVGG
ncbi:MAG TPA: hypothetical protein ENN30_02375 [Candidatus Woesearchaeota archaeon]|nr:hypothetical protein [Candidatus Woesearchaeota archaeon]